MGNANSGLKRQIVDNKAQCSQCKEWLDFDKFAKDCRTKQGLHSFCKKCKAKSDKEYRDKDKNHYSDLQRQHRENAENKFKEENPELHENGIKYRRYYKVKNKFGMTFEEYLKIFAEQDGKCAICKQPEVSKSQSGIIRDLNIDHDHKTGKIRELLCSQCNMGLGCLKDNYELLLAAAEYIKKHSQSDSPCK